MKNWGMVGKSFAFSSSIDRFKQQDSGEMPGPGDYRIPSTFISSIHRKVSFPKSKRDLEPSIDKSKHAY